MQNGDDDDNQVQYNKTYATREEYFNEKKLERVEKCKELFNAVKEKLPILKTEFNNDDVKTNRGAAKLAADVKAEFEAYQAVELKKLSDLRVAASQLEHNATVPITMSRSLGLKFRNEELRQMKKEAAKKLKMASKP